MRLYLIRHAHALSEEENPSRPLSPRGRLDTARIAAWFKTNRALDPAQLWHSPLERARETAAILAHGLDLDAVILETSGLLPEDDPAEIAERLETFPPSTNLALVGHEPHLSALATLLIRGKRKPAAFELKKGAVLALEPSGDVHKRTGRPRWHVCWHISPELLPPSAP
jgi:phosphohistidine phosphatase